MARNPTSLNSELVAYVSLDHVSEPGNDGDQVTIVRQGRDDLVDTIRAHAAAYAPDRFSTRWEPGA